MSADINELSRLRQAFNLILPTDLPRDDCPPPGQIWEAARGDLTPEMFRETLHHVAICPLCTQAWRLAEEIEGEAEARGEETPEAEVPEAEVPHTSLALRRLRPYRSLSAAAAAIVGLFVGLHFLQPGTDGGGDPAPVYRAPSKATVELLNEGPLPRDNPVLLWQGPEGVESYDLRITDLKMKRLVEESGLIQPQYRLTAETLIGLPPGSKVLINIIPRHPQKGRLRGVTHRVVIE